MDFLRMYFEKCYGKLNEDIQLELMGRKHSRDIVLTTMLSKTSIDSKDTFIVPDLKDLIEQTGGSVTPIFLKEFEAVFSSFSYGCEKECTLILTQNKRDLSHADKVFKENSFTRSANKHFYDECRKQIITILKETSHATMSVHDNEPGVYSKLYPCTKVPSIPTDPDKTDSGLVVCFNTGPKRSRKLSVVLTRLPKTNLIILKMAIPGSGNVIKRIFNTHRVDRDEVASFIVATIVANLPQVQDHIDFEKYGIKWTNTATRCNDIAIALKNCYARFMATELDVYTLYLK